MNKEDLALAKKWYIEGCLQFVNEELYSIPSVKKVVDKSIKYTWENRDNSYEEREEHCEAMTIRDHISFSVYNETECGVRFVSLRYEANFCPVCGKKLKWSDENEKR